MSDVNGWGTSSYMGDPRNWTPRKAHSVRATNAEADRDHLLTAPLYEHSAARASGKQGPHLLHMHPCDTFRVFRFKVLGTCTGCLGQWPLSRYDFDDSPLAHRPWSVVMRELVCPQCLSCPSELRFRSGDGGDVGAIATAAELTLHVASAATQITRPVQTCGRLDHLAQYDDGG